MADSKRDIRLHKGADDENVVKLDKDSPASKRARGLLARGIIKERLAIQARIQAQALRDSEAGKAASGSWGEMPRVAREHEASLVDSDTDDDGPPWAGDTELDDYGGVTACC